MILVPLNDLNSGHYSRCEIKPSNYIIKYGSLHYVFAYESVLNYSKK